MDLQLRGEPDPVPTLDEIKPDPVPTSKNYLNKIHRELFTLFMNVNIVNMNLLILYYHIPGQYKMKENCDFSRILKLDVRTGFGSGSKSDPTLFQTQIHNPACARYKLM